MNYTELALTELFSELQPEELEPRLELQVLVDPLAAFSYSPVDNNCRDGGCCAILNSDGTITADDNCPRSLYLRGMPAPIIELVQ